MNRRTAALLAVPALALTLAACGGGGGSTAAPHASATPQTYDVVVKVCQDAVRAQLKAPSTAQFASSFAFPPGNVVNWPWEVRGQVDAQNSFGAMIRSSFKCSVKQDVSDVWVAQDVSIN